MLEADDMSMCVARMFGDSRVCFDLCCRVRLSDHIRVKLVASESKEQHIYRVLLPLWLPSGIRTWVSILYLSVPCHSSRQDTLDCIHPRTSLSYHRYSLSEHRACCTGSTATLLARCAPHPGGLGIPKGDARPPTLWSVGCTIVGAVWHVL